MALKEDDNLYDKKDLEDYVNQERIDIDEGGRFYTPPKRITLLAEALGMDKQDIDSAWGGSYSGIVVFTFTLDDTLWLLKDSFGSCSYCDPLLSCDTADEAKDYPTKMCRNAYAFSDPEDAKAFVEKQRDDGYAWGWTKVADDVLDAIERQS
jgi:hypothetical protein